MSRFLPMSADEVKQLGWDSVDIVFVTGDAYVDHPSFANGLLTRLLEDEGYRVAVLAQPDWHSAAPWKQFGKPNLAFCISAGNMDSMLNHYTANRKVRNEDAYSPGGKIGLRPDRATLAYSQRAREAASAPIIIGGIEASLRRLTHYDYWSDKLKRSILLDSKADLLVYGMGEVPLLEILRRLKNGESVETIRDVRGTAYRLKQTEDLPEETETTLHLPSHEEAEEDKSQFAKMTRLIYQNLNPYLGITLVQEHDKEAVIVNPPSLPLEMKELDRIYALPFTREKHPSYGQQNIPALETVKDSVVSHRGCFGGCTFCALTAHQGKLIQSRSKESVLAEISAASAADKRTISDVGGPSANMYALDCKNEQAKIICQRLSCLVPDICPNLKTDHADYLKLLNEIRKLPNIKNVFIASGIRTDLALCDKQFVKEVALHYTGGHLKTAPEHTNANVLRLMNKPPIENYDEFCQEFLSAGSTCTPPKEQYIVPYLMAGFPGTTLKAAVETAVYLKQHGIHSEQVQEFIPVPFSLAAAMYYTGINPLDGQKIYVPTRLRERRLQKALLMWDNPAFYHDVKSALLEAGRADLIGNSPECLIKPYPPKTAALRQSSRVRRLRKQNERDKKTKQERREHFEELNKQKDVRQERKNLNRKPAVNKTFPAKRSGSSPKR
ncbi:MAG: YgiQ family radical SAM protein [Planctomycetaceae bacterium]|jgi:uncharacterized radical SAM protein YgiQ|nr:YgiQ family radical SAM protein [Planctomycetaceae bacterium]